MNLLRELEAASAAARLNPPTLKLPRRNPRPPGVPRRGSASDAVLTYLQGESGFRTHAQIVSGINRKREAEDAKPLSIKATAWALLFLRRTGPRMTNGLVIIVAPPRSAPTSMGREIMVGAAHRSGD